MKNDNVRFEIDQLRQDKIIYAVESCAVSLIGLVVILASGHLIQSERIIRLILGITLIVVLLYGIYMGRGNLIRLKKIKKLAGRLDDN